MMKEAMKIKEQTDRQREDNNAIINEIKMQKKLLENKEIKLSEKEKKLELRKQDLQKEVSQQVLMEKLKTENQMEKKYKGLIFILLTYGIVFSLCVAYRNSVLKKDIFQIGNWIKNIFIRVIQLIKKAYNIVGLEINCNIGYIQAFTEAYYQNAQAICPMHQMLAPRSTREFINYGK